MRGNPNPNLQNGLLKGQLARRDAEIDRKNQELIPLRALEAAARKRHQEICDCNGEACEIGAALMRITAVRARNQAQLRRLRGEPDPAPSSG